MQLQVYLNYGGNCAEAFRFYETHLGGTVLSVMTHGESPDPSAVSAEWKDKVLHAQMSLGDSTLMGADVPNYQPMRSAYLTLVTDSIADAERIHALLADGGEVFMAMAETFFAHRFSMLRDKFGTSWMILRLRPVQ